LGLTAAYELQNKGWQVTLLEAKPSLGGRSGMATSEWIGNDKTQPVLNKYVSTFKLSTTPAPEFVRTPGYLIDGVYYSAADLATKEPATADALKRTKRPWTTWRVRSTTRRTRPPPTRCTPWIRSTCPAGSTSKTCRPPRVS
jgi:monoamine oxidase